MKPRIFASMLIPVILSACGDADTPAKSSVTYEHMGGQGKIHLIYIEPAPSISRASYRDAVTEICKGERVCIVMFWDDKTSMPSSVPMTDVQIDTKVAHYNLNKNTSLDRLLICSEDGC